MFALSLLSSKEFISLSKNFITICVKIYYKLRQLFITNCVESLLQITSAILLQIASILLQIASDITNCVDFITNCVRYYKVRCLLQITSVHHTGQANEPIFIKVHMLKIHE